jgi:hypothetical protein
MIESSCHCGAVKLEVSDAPQVVTECNCSICWRYGALWAYYPPERVRIIAAKSATEFYLWGHKSIKFHRCQNCGCVTHWAAVDQPADRMGVNARLMPSDVLAAARRRRLDGADTWEYLNE